MIPRHVKGLSLLSNVPKCVPYCPGCAVEKERKRIYEWLGEPLGVESRVSAGYGSSHQLDALATKRMQLKAMLEEYDA